MSDPLSGVIPQRQAVDDDADAMARLNALSRLSQLVAAADVDLGFNAWPSLHHELARYGLGLVIAWLRSGQQLPTDSTPEAIIDAIVRSAGVIEPTAPTPRRPPATPATPQPTPRQGQILQQVADGKTNPEIAKSLEIDVSTIGNHLTNLGKRWGVGAHRGKLVAIGIRDGWITP